MINKHNFISMKFKNISRTESKSILFVGNNLKNKYILYNNLIKMNKGFNIVIISPFEKYYNGLFGKNFVYNEFNDEIIKKILFDGSNGLKTFVILDDIEIKKEYNNLMELLYNGRHYNIKFIANIKNKSIFNDGNTFTFDNILLSTIDYNIENIDLCKKYIGNIFDLSADEFIKQFGKTNIINICWGENKIYWFDVNNIQYTV